MSLLRKLKGLGLRKILIQHRGAAKMKKGRKHIGRADAAVDYLFKDPEHKIYGNSSGLFYRADPDEGIQVYDSEDNSWIHFSPNNLKVIGADTKPRFETDTFYDVEEECEEADYRESSIDGLMCCLKSAFTEVSKTACRDEHIVQAAMEEVAKKLLAIGDERYQKKNEVIKIEAGGRG